MTKKTNIDIDELKKLGKLSRLDVVDDNSQGLINDLNEIIGFIDQLNEVNTDNVKPLSSVTGHALPLRDDKVCDGNINHSILRKPEKKSGYFVVPKVTNEMKELLKYSIKDVLNLLKKEFSVSELVRTYISN